MRTYNFFDWVSNTVWEPKLVWAIGLGAIFLLKFRHLPPGDLAIPAFDTWLNVNWTHVFFACMLKYFGAAFGAHLPSIQYMMATSSLSSTSSYLPRCRTTGIFQNFIFPSNIQNVMEHFEQPQCDPWGGVTYQMRFPLSNWTCGGDRTPSDSRVVAAAGVAWLPFRASIDPFVDTPDMYLRMCRAKHFG